MVCVCLVAGGLAAANAQPKPKVKPKSPPPAKTAETPETPKTPQTPDPFRPFRGNRGEVVGSQEKVIAVDPNVSVKLCVADGDLTINGSERNEVRVFVHNGRPFVLKPLEKDEASKLPVWVWIASKAAEGRPQGAFPECLAGDSIEIDVPLKASLNVSGRTASAAIDSVKKVSVKVIEGQIDLRNISGGVSAETFQGDVTLSSSSGQISLQTTTGNVIVFDVKPGAIGELMKVSTNSGTITLDNIAHRQIEARSISGSVNFKGRFLNNGIYTFNTSNGSLRLLLPANTSCKVSASYGYGAFNSDFPYKLVTETITPGGKNIQAVIGSGAATVNLTTTNGSIGIRKQP